MDQKLDAEIDAIFRKHEPEYGGVEKLERMKFIERTRGCFAIISTGETRKYSNVILTKGLAFPDL